MAWKDILSAAILGSDRSEIPDSVRAALLQAGAPEGGSPEEQLLNGVIFFSFREKFAKTPTRWLSELPSPHPMPQAFSPKAIQLLQTLLHPDAQPLLIEWLEDQNPWPMALLPELLDICLVKPAVKKVVVPLLSEQVKDLVAQHPKWVQLLKSLPATDVATEIPLGLTDLAIRWLKQHPAGFFEPDIPEKLSEKGPLSVFLQKKATGFQGGKKAGLLFRLVAHIHPDWWEQQFGLPPETLLALHRNHPWEQALIQGWIAACTRFGSSTWAAALCTFIGSDGRQLYLDSLTANPIADLLSDDDFYALMDTMLNRWQNNPQGQHLLQELLARNHRAWTPVFSRRVMALLQMIMQKVPPVERYTAILANAARCIPPAMYDEVQQTWGNFSGYERYNWVPAVEQCMRVLLLRKQLYQLSQDILSNHE